MEWNAEIGSRWGGVVLTLAIWLGAGAAPSLAQDRVVSTTDPAGDAVGEGPRVDVDRLSVDAGADPVRFRLDFIHRISPADSGRDDALFGFIDLDLDQTAATGARSMAEFLGLSSPQLGSEALLDLSTYRAADGSVDWLKDDQTQRVPARFSDRSVEVTVPLAALAGDRSFATVAVVGNGLEAGDVVPDQGGLATGDEPESGVFLGGNRFRVKVIWSSGGATGEGHLVFQSDDSAVFWFFNAANWELMVKVIDGCSINDRFWVFSAATTDVEFTVEVTDTVTGAARTYRNPQGVAAPAVTDSDAFSGCQAGS